MEGREATQTIATLGGFFQPSLPAPREPGVRLRCTLLWQEDTEASKWGQFSYALPPSYPDDAKAGVPLAAKQDKEAK